MTPRFLLLPLALGSLSALGCGGTNDGRPDAGVDCTASDGVDQMILSDFELGAATGGWYLNNDICDTCSNLLINALDGGTAISTPAQLENDLVGCNARCGASQTPGITEKPLPSEQIPVSPRCGSRYALHVRGGPFTNWGGVIGLQFSSTHPLDASGWTGVSFWARVAPDSRTTVRVQVTDRYTDANYAQDPVCIPNQTRDMTRSGCDAHGSNAILGPDWHFFKLRFDLMQQGGWGLPAPVFDLTTILSIAFQYPAGTWDIWLDDMGLYREKAQ